MPLIPAWAITVHKSQGMTLTKVEVDLSRAFEREMIYVALSRCKTLEGLKVHRLPRDMRYGPDATVQEFLTKFTSAGAFIRPAIEGGRPKPSGSDARNAIMLE